MGRALKYLGHSNHRRSCGGLRVIAHVVAARFKQVLGFCQSPAKRTTHPLVLCPSKTSALSACRFRFWRTGPTKTAKLAYLHNPWVSNRSWRHYKRAANWVSTASTYTNAATRSDDSNVGSNGSDAFSLATTSQTSCSPPLSPSPSSRTCAASVNALSQQYGLGLGVVHSRSLRAI